ncbi:MAG: hypothetical protein FJ286_10870 [Planctomycetes bacterium]|nr:hypothetical protein [Planctomycetota bacterium]
MPRHAIHLGTAWEPPAAAGRPWIRRFGRPSGVEPGDRVLLVWDPPGTVRPEVLQLNGQALVADPEIDITPLLRDRNELVLGGSGLPVGSAPARLVALPVACGRPTLVIVSSD